MESLCLASFTQHSVLLCVSVSVPFIAEWCFIELIYLNLFIHSSVDEHLACFQLGVIINKTVMNILLVDLSFHFFMCNYLVESWVLNKSAFNLLKIYQIVLRNSYTVLCSPAVYEFQFHVFTILWCYQSLIYAVLFYFYFFILIPV